MEIILLYITVKDKSEAEHIARTLLDEYLIACANIIPGVTSMYRWEGEMQAEPEVLLLAKTTADRQEQATQRIKELHSYDMPCIVAYQSSGGYAPFGEWIFSATRD